MHVDWTTIFYRSVVTIEVREITFTGGEDTMSTALYRVAFLGIVEIVAALLEYMR